MTAYALLKFVHVACVILSGAGFLLRGSWALSGSALLYHPLTRRLPHFVDTVLLLSAATLAWLLRQFPFVAPWVTAKVLGLVVYIVLGIIALRRGRSQWARGIALVAACLVYAWIVSVALSKNPWGFLG